MNVLADFYGRTSGSNQGIWVVWNAVKATSKSAPLQESVKQLEGKPAALTKLQVETDKFIEITT